jgi:very-short-patch-repair endonuclease
MRIMRKGAKTEFARQLRKTMTDAETRLWFRLRRKQLGGFHFRKQHPMGPFIADFACVEKRLIVEIDGGQHNKSMDADRDAWFHRNDYRVLRFWNNDVLTGTNDVVAAILAELEKTCPHPILPPRAGEGVNRSAL